MTCRYVVEWAAYVTVSIFLGTADESLIERVGIAVFGREFP